MYESLIPALMAIILLTPIAAAAPIAAYWSVRPDPRGVRPLAYLAVAGLGVSAIAATYIAVAYPMRPIIFSAPWFSTPYLTANVSFSVDFLSRFMGLITAWIAFTIGVYALDYMARDYRLGWYWFWYNLFTSSMLLTVYANDLVLMLIGWTFLGLSSWALIGNWYKDDDELTFVGRVGDRTLLGVPAWTTPSYAAYRAICTIKVGDSLMMFAIGAIGVLGHSFEYITYRNNVLCSGIDWNSIMSALGPIGMIVLIIAFAMGPFTKSAQFPFNDWLLTAMTGPTTVSALLHSATMVAAGVYIFMRLTESLRLAGMFEHYSVVISYTVILYVGLLTALLGSIFATATDERKVILAGSTMASLGLMMGITALTPYIHETVTIGEYEVAVPVFTAFLYLILHAISKATLFLTAGHLIHVTHTRFNVGDWELAKRMSLGFYATLAAALSLSGVPPLAGYWIHAAMDELVHHAVPEAGAGAYALLLLASLAYVAFLARFVSLNFMKGGRPHHVEHERLPFMVSAYTAGGTAALAVLLVPLTVGSHVFVTAGLSPTFMIVGAVLWLVFVIAMLKPRIGHLGVITKIFERRYYLQTFIDVLVRGFGGILSSSMFRGFFRWFDRFINFLVAETFGGMCTLSSFRSCFRGFDRFLNFILCEAVLRLSRRIRAVQIGSLRAYLNIVLSVIISIMLVVLCVMYLIAA